MLEIRPGCENCGRDLPPDSVEAMICSFECTFCRDCVTRVLANVCPNCGGGFERRPVRPSGEWVSGANLARAPAGTRRVERPVDPDTHARLVARVAGVSADQR